MNDAMLEIGPIPFDDDDYALAKRFRDTLPPGPAAERNILNSDISAYQVQHFSMPGSTDVGDVSYNTPTAQLLAATCCVGTGAHTWQMTAQGCTPAAHKGLLFAGKSMALTAVKLSKDPGILKSAREEFIKSTGGRKYKPLFPDDIMPELG